VTPWAACVDTLGVRTRSPGVPTPQPLLVTQDHSQTGRRVALHAPPVYAARGRTVKSLRRGSPTASQTGRTPRQPEAGQTAPRISLLRREQRGPSVELPLSARCHGVSRETFNCSPLSASPSLFFRPYLVWRRATKSKARVTPRDTSPPGGFPRLGYRGGGSGRQAGSRRTPAGAPGRPAAPRSRPRRRRTGPRHILARPSVPTEHLLRFRWHGWYRYHYLLFLHSRQRGSCDGRRGGGESDYKVSGTRATCANLSRRPRCRPRP
jgi:hypothetical protein